MHYGVQALWHADHFPHVANVRDTYRRLLWSMKFASHVPRAKRV